MTSLNGQPEAILQDNPAFFGAFDAATGVVYEIDTNINYYSSISLPAVYYSSCGQPSSAVVCTIKKTFIKNYALKADPHGYIIAYERCCRNASIVNIIDPGNGGSTYYCTIPASPVTNSSAIFKNDPLQVACINKPLYFDHSATDADGDSLSYCFCPALKGANESDIKPIPYYPALGDSVQYVNPPYSSQVPLTGAPAITIDPVTGVISGTPNKIGRYLVNVCCNEWRNGVLINTVRREFQVVVTDCSTEAFKPVAGPDTIVTVGANVQLHVSPGAVYKWTPSAFLSDATVANPVGTFTVPGVFTYIVDVVNDSGCNGSNTVTITVYETSAFIVPLAFTPNGDSRNDILKPIPVLGSTLISFKIFNRLGNLVYNGGPNDPGWDGTYNGSKQDLGVYYWEILFVDNTGNKRRMKGDVTLVR